MVIGLFNAIKASFPNTSQSIINDLVNAQNDVSTLQLLTLRLQSGMRPFDLLALSIDEDHKSYIKCFHQD